jgi:HAD superfamily hydrolase (TIGR01490 family)
MNLAIFDLDGTLISGDSDLLWTQFLAGAGEIDAALLEEAGEVAARYSAGTVVPEAYCSFQARLLAGRTRAELLPLQQRFLAHVVRPRIPAAARALVQQHRDAGDRLVLTTATPRVVSELTARELGFDDHLCTELEWQGERCTGRIQGPPNMRAGKVERLRRWLAEQGLGDALLRRASFYSDSINDLALLSVVGRPVVVDPDARLWSTALRKGWQVLRLHPQPQRVAAQPSPA